MRAGLVAVLIAALAAAADAAGTPQRASGSLELNQTLLSSRTVSRQFCPPGTPESAVCAFYVAERRIRGLGLVKSSYTKVITLGDPDCETLLLSPLHLEVAGKGGFDVSTRGRVCWRFQQTPFSVGPFQFDVSGGSGPYAGASGTLTWRSTVTDQPPGSIDRWAGTLAAPGHEFDLTPPVFRGVRNIVVRTPKRAKRMRVRYSVTATDAVDGTVRATCTPRSGAFFKLGRTKVTCGATDTSENSADASFRVTVRSRR